MTSDFQPPEWNLERPAPVFLFGFHDGYVGVVSLDFWKTFSEMPLGGSGASGAYDTDDMTACERYLQALIDGILVRESWPALWTAHSTDGVLVAAQLQQRGLFHDAELQDHLTSIPSMAPYHR